MGPRRLVGELKRPTHQRGALSRIACLPIVRAPQFTCPRQLANLIPLDYRAFPITLHGPKDRWFGFVGVILTKHCDRYGAANKLAVDTDVGSSRATYTRKRKLSLSYMIRANRWFGGPYTCYSFVCLSLKFAY